MIDKKEIRAWEAAWEAFEFRFKHGGWEAAWAAYTASNAWDPAWEAVRVALKDIEDYECKKN